MLPFSLDPFVTLNRACVSVFGKSVSIQYIPKSGEGPIPISGIPQEPPVLEGYPINNSGKPNSIIHLFVSFPDIVPSPSVGDVFSIAGASYTMFDIGTDASQGTFLKMRRNA